jgi:hypothetical protein
MASSKILAPHPLPSVLHVLGAGGGHTRWLERGGGGVNILEDVRHSSVLYVCKYFVVPTGILYL